MPWMRTKSSCSMQEALICSSGCIGRSLTYAQHVSFVVTGSFAEIRWLQVDVQGGSKAEQCRVAKEWSERCSAAQHPCTWANSADTTRTNSAGTTAGLELQQTSTLHNTSTSCTRDNGEPQPVQRGGQELLLSREQQPHSPREVRSVPRPSLPLPPPPPRTGRPQSNPPPPGSGPQGPQP